MIFVIRILYLYFEYEIKKNYLLIVDVLSICDMFVIFV